MGLATSVDDPRDELFVNMNKGSVKRLLESAATANRAAFCREFGADTDGDPIDVRGDYIVGLKGGLYYIEGGPIYMRPVTGGPVFSGCGGPIGEHGYGEYEAKSENNLAARLSSVTTICRLDAPTPGTGGVDNSILHCPSSGAIIERLTFMGRQITGNFTYAGDRTDYAIVFEWLSGGLEVTGAKAEIRNCAFQQCRWAIYAAPSDQCDTVTISGVIMVSNYRAAAESFDGPWGFIKNSEQQAFGWNIPALVTFASDTGDCWFFDASEGNGSEPAGGLVNACGLIKFNRSGGIMRTGVTSHNAGACHFNNVKWDNGLNNGARAYAFEMTTPNAFPVYAGLSLGQSTPANYRRPLVYPCGNLYHIEMKDLQWTQFHQVDRDAWPVGGVTPDDDCMEEVAPYIPVKTPTAWWSFGKPADQGSPADGVALTDVIDRAGSFDLAQGSAPSQGTYTYDAIHHRPGLVCSSDYYEIADATSLGKGAATLNIEWAGAPRTQGSFATICAVSGGASAFCYALIYNTDGTFSFYFQGASGQANTASALNHSLVVREESQCYVTVRFTGSGTVELTVNGVTNRTTASMATLYNGANKFYIGANNSGSISNFFYGVHYDLKIDTDSLPDATEQALRRDIICSQIGTPVDVYVPESVFSAPNTSSPTTITSAYAHGLDNPIFTLTQPQRYVTISGATGNTAINGTWLATVTGRFTFTIPVAGNGTYGAASATYTAI